MKRCFALVFVLFGLLHAAPGFALERAYNPWPSDGASVDVDGVRPCMVGFVVQ